MDKKNLLDNMAASMQGVGVDAMIQATTNETPEVKKHTQGKKNKGGDGKLKITSVALDVELHRFYKKLAVDGGSSLQELINEALLKFAKKKGFEE